MTSQISNKAGTYSVPCFGQHLEGHVECKKCPVATDCKFLKDAKLVASVKGPQFAPLEASYLVLSDTPELPGSTIFRMGEGLTSIVSGDSYQLELATTEVIPGHYTNPEITVDEFGRVKNIFSSLPTFTYNINYVTPQINQVLTWDGGCWSPLWAATSSICEAFDYDSAVEPTKGQVIAWNGTSYAPADPQVVQSKISGEIVASGRTEIAYTTQNIFYEDPDNATCALEIIPWKDKPRHVIQYSIECQSDPPHSWISETFQNGFVFTMAFPFNNSVFLHWVTRNV